MLAFLSRLALGALLLATLLGTTPTHAAQVQAQAQAHRVEALLQQAGAGGSPPATSQTDERELEGVLCQTTYNWPSYLHRGFFPVNVRLINQNEDSVVVDLAAETRWWEEDSVTRRVMLNPGQEASFEMLLRARGNGQNDYRLHVEIGREEVYLGACGPVVRHRRGGAPQHVMLVTAEELGAGTAEDLVKEWADRDGKTTWFTGSNTVSARTFDQLSTTWQAYTSLDTVILDLSVGELPEVAILEALAAWCRAGGTLVVLGLPAESIAQFPAIGPIIEERFERPPAVWPYRADPGFTPPDQVFEERGLVAYRSGFGTLICTRGEGVGALSPTGPDGLSTAYVAVRALVPEAWSRETRSTTGDSIQEEIEDFLGQFGTLPLRSLMALMVLFALLLGPANFMWVKRKKKPMLLLVSVPAIALGSSIVLLVYGVLSQGLDIRAATRTWAVLDQVHQQSTTSEVRRVFAGRSPGEGLRPQVGTLVMPGSHKWYGTTRQESLFIRDSTDGLVLSGDYFPVRQEFVQMIVSDRTSRLRLDARLVGGDVQVTNALGTTVRELLLRTSDGKYYALQGPLGEGDSATLVPTGGQDQLRGWVDDLRRYGDVDKRTLMPGSYIAELSEASLRDDCGVPVREVDARHVLLGILDTSGGAL